MHPSSTRTVRLTDVFGRGSGHGLLQLGGGEIGQILPPMFTWWRSFAARYVTSLCLHAGSSDGASSPPDVPAPSAAELAALALTTPMMSGSEYLAPDVLLVLWKETASACAQAQVSSFHRVFL
jgi:non-specific serine/threonine protein kinase